MYIEKNTEILKEDFILVIKFILSSTYFTFNKIMYKQTYGILMSSLLSPIIIGTQEKRHYGWLVLIYLFITSMTYY